MDYATTFNQLMARPLYNQTPQTPGLSGAGSIDPVAMLKLYKALNPDPAKTPGVTPPVTPGDPTGGQGPAMLGGTSSLYGMGGAGGGIM